LQIISVLFLFDRCSNFGGNGIFWMV